MIISPYLDRCMLYLTTSKCSYNLDRSHKSHQENLAVAKSATCMQDWVGGAHVCMAWCMCKKCTCMVEHACRERPYSIMDPHVYILVHGAVCIILYKHAWYTLASHNYPCACACMWLLLCMQTWTLPYTCAHACICMLLKVHACPIMDACMHMQAAASGSTDACTCTHACTCTAGTCMHS